MNLLRYLKILCAVFAFFTLSHTQAAVYTFSQGGFDDGGKITGSFTGADLDNDGQISYFLSAGEVTAFNASYTGGSTIPDFNFGLAELFALTWDVGSPYIGDGNNGFAEGLMLDFNNSFYVYQVSEAIFGLVGGQLLYQVAPGSFFTATSEELVPVTEQSSNVPLPSSLVLLVFAGAFLLRKRQA